LASFLLKGERFFCFRLRSWFNQALIKRDTISENYPRRLRVRGELSMRPSRKRIDAYCHQKNRCLLSPMENVEKEKEQWAYPKSREKLCRNPEKPSNPSQVTTRQVTTNVTRQRAKRRGSAASSHTKSKIWEKPEKKRSGQDTINDQVYKGNESKKLH